MSCNRFGLPDEALCVQVPRIVDAGTAVRVRTHRTCLRQSDGEKVASVGYVRSTHSMIEDHLARRGGDNLPAYCQAPFS